MNKYTYTYNSKTFNLQTAGAGLTGWMCYINGEDFLLPIVKDEQKALELAKKYIQKNN